MIGKEGSVSMDDLKGINGLNDEVLPPDFNEESESESLSDNVKWGTRKRFEKGIPNGRFQIYGYRWEGDHLVVEPEEAKIVNNNAVNLLSTSILFSKTSAHISCN